MCRFRAQMDFSNQSCLYTMFYQLAPAWGLLYDTHITVKRDEIFPYVYGDKVINSYKISIKTTIRINNTAVIISSLTFK